MKRVLRAVLSFLERKFPDKLEIRVEEFNALNAKLAALEAKLAQSSDVAKDIQKLQSQINALHTALGFASPAGRGAGMLER